MSGKSEAGKVGETMHRQEDTRRQGKNGGLSSEMGLDLGLGAQTFPKQKASSGFIPTTQRHVGLLLQFVLYSVLHGASLGVAVPMESSFC